MGTKSGRKKSMPSFTERVERAVLSQIEASLDRLNKKGEAIFGLPKDAFSPFKDRVSARLRHDLSEIADSFKNAREGKRGVLFLIGKDEESTSADFADSLVAGALAMEMKNILETLENFADQMVEAWAKAKTGCDAVVINFRSLAVQEKLGLFDFLDVIHQVLSYEPERLQRVVEKAKNHTEGLPVFIRDLGEARLSGPAMEVLLLGIYHAKTGEEIDALFAGMDPDDKEVFGKPVEFMCQVMKRNLSLPESKQKEIVIEVEADNFPALPD